VLFLALLITQILALKAVGRSPTTATALEVPHADAPLHALDGMGRLHGGINICDLCWNFVSCCLDDVINVILNGGGDTCAGVCDQIQSSLYAQICTGLCDFVGFGAFVLLLKQSDLYPVHLCVELHSCTPNNCTSGCGSMTQLSVVPRVSQIGNPLSVAVAFTALKSIGSGEVYFNVFGPDVFGSPMQLEVHELIDDGMTPGQYNWSFSVPTSGYVLPVPSGTYIGNVSVCAGDCQDTTAGVVLAQRKVTFQLTDNKR